MSSRENAMFISHGVMPQSQGLMMQLGDLFHLMEQASTDHVHALNLEQGQEKGRTLFWVLNRMRVELQAMPQAGQAIQIVTWPNEANHGLYPRQYQIRSETGELLLRAVSIWTLMDSQTRKMVHCSELAGRLWWADEQDMPLPQSIKPMQTQKTIRRLARPEEMDQNRHINNANYVRWLEPLLPEGYALEHRLRTFQINYVAELYPQDAVELHYDMDADVMKVEGHSGGRRSFAVLAQFVKNSI